jgi:hypothetical protein
MKNKLKAFLITISIFIGIPLIMLSLYFYPHIAGPIILCIMMFIFSIITYQFILKYLEI